MMYEADIKNKKTSNYLFLNHSGKSKEISFCMNGKEVEMTKEQLHEFIGTLLHIQQKMSK